MTDKPRSRHNWQLFREVTDGFTQNAAFIPTPDSVRENVDTETYSVMRAYVLEVLERVIKLLGLTEVEIDIDTSDHSVDGYFRKTEIGGEIRINSQLLNALVQLSENAKESANTKDAVTTFLNLIHTVVHEMYHLYISMINPEFDKESIRVNRYYLESEDLLRHLELDKLMGIINDTEYNQKYQHLSVNREYAFWMYKADQGEFLARGFGYRVIRELIQIAQQKQQSGVPLSSPEKIMISAGNMYLEEKKEELQEMSFISLNPEQVLHNVMLGQDEYVSYYVNTLPE